MTERKHTAARPEILAPAGTYEALEAAVAAGADAVYLGGELFGARAFAGNFPEEVLLKALDYAHLFDIKIYLTVNTLFKENEIEKLAAFLKPFYLQGLDAVLVQDPGACKLIKQAFPDLALHASTQMSISSVYGAELLKQAGFSRIVPARELSLKEIQTIHKCVDIEIETFVHGAMCFAYSGKCLLSSFIGGRSGNRGRCAQPCRQWYAPEGRLYAGEHMMSLKDMCALEFLPLLADAGIASFKIEGRMKNPQYVASAVYAYRKAEESYLEKKELYQACFADWSGEEKQAYLEEAASLKKQLMDIYNRGGFCSGYYFPDKGREMLAADRPNHTGLRIGTVKSVREPDVRIQLTETLHKGDVVEIRLPHGGTRKMPDKELSEVIELTAGQTVEAGALAVLKGRRLKEILPGMEVFRTRNEELLKTVQSQIIDRERKVTGRAFVRAVLNEPLLIRIEGADGVCSEAEGSIVQKAGKRPVSKEQLKEKLDRTGGSHVQLETDFRIDDNIFISMSEFNSLRRQAAEEFRVKLAQRYHRDKKRK